MHASYGSQGSDAAADAAGVVVYRRAGDGSVYFLLLRCARAGHWTPPKGHVDPGESERSTALRETREETNLREGGLFVDRTFRMEIVYPVASVGGLRDKRVVYFLGEASLTAGVSLSFEHDAFAWLNVERACERVGFPNLQGVLRAVAEHLDLRR